ncbi:hypothetical protein PDE01_26480 [Paracoccus denitrificans]|nr:hypothetical protein PDE01_26480 [Paracoccus denitrificans]
MLSVRITAGANWAAVRAAGSVGASCAAAGMARASAIKAGSAMRHLVRVLGVIVILLFVGRRQRQINGKVGGNIKGLPAPPPG